MNLIGTGRGRKTSKNSKQKDIKGFCHTRGQGLSIGILGRFTIEKPHYLRKKKKKKRETIRDTPVFCPGIK